MLSSSIRQLRALPKNVHVKASLASCMSSDAQKAPAIALHPFTLDGKPLDVNQPTTPSDMFAVIAHSGTQYKVSQDDTIVVDKISGVDIGDQIELDEVLLVDFSVPMQPQSRVCES